MGKKRIDVNKINEILRLKSLGHSKIETAKLLNLNRYLMEVQHEKKC